MISLSHVALPFPPDDPLYGQRPPDNEDVLFLGQMAIQGERGLLKLSSDWLLRLRHDPFLRLPGGARTGMAEQDRRRGRGRGASAPAMTKKHGAALPGGHLRLRMKKGIRGRPIRVGRGVSGIPSGSPTTSRRS